MNKIKIALCLSGEPRSSMASFPYIYEAFLKNSKDYNIDTYIHSWKGFRALDLYKPKKFNIEPIHPDKYFQNLIESLGIEWPKELYSLLKFEDRFTPKNNSITNSFLMLSSMLKSYKLIDKPYDLYIRCRPDIFFSNPFDIRYLIMDILIKKEYDIYIPYKSFNNHNIDILTDQIAIGNFKSMHVYFNLLNNLNSILQKRPIWGIEKHIKPYLIENNISIRSYPGNFGLVRQSTILTNDPNFNNFLDE